MPYSYDDFLKSATSSGNLGKFSTDDLDLAYDNPEYGMSMLSLMNDYSGAQTDEQRALINETQNQLRNSYTAKSRRSAQNNGYNSVYQDRIDDLTGKAVTHGSFNFSLKDNPAWSTYKKNYLREGDRAAANALAAASNASAGRPSSYAVTAAQQANDYWDTQLANIVPQLYTQDYNMWVDDFNRLLTNLNMLRDQDESEYARYLDQLNMDYQKERDAAADDQKNFANALSIYQLLGGSSPKWVLDALGLAGAGGSGSLAGEGTGGSGSGGGYYGSGSDPDKEMQDLQRIQTILNNWSNGKFSGADANTIADTPGILELLMSDENGNVIGSVPTDTAGRRRMANALLLEQYGNWQDRGYRKDQRGNFIRDENGNPIPDGSGTAAGSWTADDQRQEQMMIRRMNDIEAGMDAEASQKWQEAKQMYQNGESSKDDLYGWLDDEFMKGNMSYADYRVLTTRVSALPSDVSQVGSTGATGAGIGAGSGEDVIAGAGSGAGLPAVSARFNDALAGLLGAGNITHPMQLVRSALDAAGIDTRDMTDEEAQAVAGILRTRSSAAGTQGQTGTGAGTYTGILDNAENTAGQSNLDAAVNVLRDWESGAWNDIQNYLRGIGAAEAEASTPEGRAANAAQMEAYRNFVPTGDPAADAAELRRIGSMGTGLYYDEATGTIQSVKPLTGDEIIGGSGEDAIFPQNNRVYTGVSQKAQNPENAASGNAYQNILDALAPTGNTISRAAGSLGNIANTLAARIQEITNQQAATGAGSGEDAIYSPTSGRVYNGVSQKAQNPENAAAGNVYQNILDGAQKAGSSLTSSLSNLANSLQTRIQQVAEQQAAAQQAAARAAAVATGAGSGNDSVYTPTTKTSNGRTYSGTSQKASDHNNDQYIDTTTLPSAAQLAAAMASVLPKPAASAASVVTKPSSTRGGATR